MTNSVPAPAPSRNPLAFSGIALVLWTVSSRAADLVAAARIVSLLIPWPAEALGPYSADAPPVSAEALDRWVAEHVSTAGHAVTLGPAMAGRHARGPVIVVPLRPAQYVGHSTMIRREVWALAARYWPVYIDAYCDDATTPDALYATRRDAGGVTLDTIARTCRELSLRATLLDSRGGTIVCVVDSDGDVVEAELM